MCMHHKNNSQPHTESGFALIMTLIIVGVLISIGLTVLELTISQVKLSTNARASEVAFNAANAGLECARYWRRQASDAMEIGDQIAPECFGDDIYITGSPVSPSSVSGTGAGDVYLYDYEFTWGEAGDRCTQVITLVVVSEDVPLNELVVSEAAILAVIPGYDGSDLSCTAGARCTVMSVRGYNSNCTQVSNFGTVQREVLLQF